MSPVVWIKNNKLLTALLVIIAFFLFNSFGSLFGVRLPRTTTSVSKPVGMAFEESVYSGDTVDPPSGEAKLIFQDCQFFDPPDGGVHISYQRLTRELDDATKAKMHKMEIKTSSFIVVLEGDKNLSLGRSVEFEDEESVDFVELAFVLLGAIIGTNLIRPILFCYVSKKKFLFLIRVAPITHYSIF